MFSTIKLRSISTDSYFSFHIIECLPEEWNWQNGRACSLPRMTEIFTNSYENNLELAKEECANACVARKDCKFARVYKNDLGTLHTCALNKECGEIKDKANSHLFNKWVPLSTKQ